MEGPGRLSAARAPQDIPTNEVPKLLSVFELLQTGLYPAQFECRGAADGGEMHEV